MRAERGWLLADTWLENRLIKLNATCVRPYGYGHLIGTVDKRNYSGKIKYPLITLIDYWLSQSLSWLHPYLILPISNFYTRLKRLKDKK